LAVYIEVDAWVPTELAPFLSKGSEPREYNGVKGERLRTVKLRGQVSQGLLLPLTVLPRSLGFEFAKVDGSAVGEDVSHWLGIQKWEAPVPAQLAGQVRGAFPSLVPKTDQERVANLTSEWEDYKVRKYSVNEKLEGTSCTMTLVDGDFHVCSRNLSLKNDGVNTYWKMALLGDVERKLREFNFDNIAIQSEIVGPGIQSNIYKLATTMFYVFDVYDIKAQKYYSPEEMVAFCEKLNLTHVPILGVVDLSDKTVEDVILMADGFSQLNKNVRREGIVFKSLNSTHHFKSVSVQYLLKYDL
jgi:RNA ligase (TIGR02306 family)